MAAIRKVQKNGGSLNINLPSEYCDELDVHLGDSLLFQLHGRGVLVVVKADFEKYPDLKILTPEGIPSLQYEKYLQ